MSKAIRKQLAKLILWIYKKGEENGCKISAEDREYIAAANEMLNE
jgi:hypothetical protein